MGRQDRPERTDRRLREVFGDVLPEVTADERDEGSYRAAEQRDRDRWLRENRPPHHDGD